MSQTEKRRTARASMGGNPALAGLFLALLFFLLAYPLVTEDPVGSLFLDVLFTAMLVASAYAVSHKRKILVTAIVLALPTIGSWWTVRLFESKALILVGLALSIVFFLFILVVLFRNVLQSEEVTVDTIYGAMSAYLIIGVAWSLVYALLEVASPGAFNFGSLQTAAKDYSSHGELRFLLYYSLVTLSTLGYGDITPLSPLARSLSSLEAVVGQLYIAVLIARLVGIHIAQKHSK